ncbi:MAG: hypothetical protein DI568_12690 [Sphingomonas sp.]|nr:MAG: hypothetical protein DI568_12690 [Sphingomonas sp.]
MSYGFEQWAALASANQNLVLKFAEISRTAALRQAEIAQQGFSAFVDQNTEQKAGVVALPGFTELSDVLKEVEQNRQTSLAAAQEAFSEWSSSVGDLFKVDGFKVGDVQQPFADAVQAWSKQFQAMAGGTAPIEAGKAK